MPVRWPVAKKLLTAIRRVVGTQAILARLGPAPFALPPPSPLQTAAAAKLQDLYHRLAASEVEDESLGFKRDQMPVLIDVNGDLIWVPADLLPFLWHTKVAGDSDFLLHFLVETPHYVWIRNRLRRGDVAIDCGACLGLFTTMMAERVGPTGSVHAFEPNAETAGDLKRVLRLNHLGWPVVHCCAVGDRCGEAAFCSITERDVRREGSHLSLTGRASFVARIKHREVRVPLVTLDQFVGDRSIIPHMIKVDVEGAEFHVLEGARRCVAAHRPTLVIEIHEDGEGRFDHDRLRAYLREHGYRFAAEGKIYYCEP